MLDKIGFFSPLAGVGVDCGYGYAAVELIQAWQRLGIPVWSFDRDAPVIFNMGQPQFYERVEGKLNIGYTPWESTGVPDAWVKKMNTMDEIWCTCTANLEWYRDAGVEVPMRVLHHGINDEHWPIVRREWKNGPFKFFHLGGDSNRKGAHIVYEVFKDKFGDDTDVHLLLKGRRLSFTPKGPNVTHVSDIISSDALREMYLQQHAMVYPTNGEGFGLIPFQAAATGMPTAVTDWSAPRDYMDFCWPINVDSLVEPDYIPHEGLWANPSKLSVEYFMHDVVNQHEMMFKVAASGARHMRPEWTWDFIAQKSVEWIMESLNSRHDK